MKKFFLARRFSWPITFSVCLHASLIGGLVFASIKDQVEIPIAEEAAPMNVVMVNPAMFAAPQANAEQETQATEAKSEPEEPDVSEPEPIPEPEPVVIPEPIPEPKPAEKPIEKPKTEKKPEPKPVQKPKKQPKKEPKKEPVEKADIDKPAASPLTSSNISPVTSGPQSSAQGAAPSTGSKILKQVEPAYPKQAFDRRIEGEIKVMFDINEDGRIENVRIISATPPRMFERDVKLALKKWRYTPVVVKDKTLTIIFKIDGGAKIQ
ncbi:TonB family protein [Budvicia aquatica]|uniref:TonB family protein n=1 Tax=Budvicia aquatica TaxID=82979 RepID=UPI0021C3C1E3|nr:TonB family protein [Budvicia aquatica]